MAKEENWLFFVDTNVFLDFYRYPGEPAKRQLDGLLKHKNRLIVTEQLRMEYLKNRQNVIVDSLKGISKPTGQMPAILADSKFGKAALKVEKTLKEKNEKLQKYLNNLITNPNAYDSVFKTANKIFESNHEFNLKRPNKERFSVRISARRRFILGYPPRKNGDTSIGDAINWEWIIRCAEQAPDKPNILIVSRDGDFGVTQGKTTTLNDWLKWEFKQRIPGRRKIELTNKLTVALRKLDEIVTPDDEAIEERVIENYPINALGKLADAELAADWLKHFTNSEMTLRDLGVALRHGDDIPKK